MKIDEYINSCQFVLNKAVLEIYPSVQLVDSFNNNNGFFSDFDIQSISETDFEKIELKMKEIIAQASNFLSIKLNQSEALDWFKAINQPYRVKQLENLFQDNKQNFIELCKIDNFQDLSKGKYLKNVSDLKYFKIMSVSGVYLDNDIKKKQVQRIHVNVFKDKQAMVDYFQALDQAQLRDHRRLGVSLDLFVFSDLVGIGLPLFTPRGTILREELSNFSNELRLKHGFQKVFIPHLTKKDLYEKSGHWSKFGDELFLVNSQETSDQLILKPMNCPHHTRIYASQPRSYKDLPIRYLETTTVYRDEKTGELGGLNRVRSITQDDSHVFCATDQIEDEISFLLESAQRFYQTVGMSLRVRLSYRDNSNGYLGSQEIWQTSQLQLKNAVEKIDLEYFEQEGEAAFYGPKIDFMATDALNREHQVATVQLDFVQPERFNLNYIDQNNDKKTPIMIHCALMGSIERFLAVYIEHTNGNFPVWNAPEQLRIITVNQDEKILKYVNQIIEMCQMGNIRFFLDNQSESVSKKIKQAELLKIPYVLVIGEKEFHEKVVLPRIRRDLRNNSNNLEPLQIDNFFATIQTEIKNRSSKTSLDL